MQEKGVPFVSHAAGCPASARTLRQEGPPERSCELTVE